VDKIELIVVLLVVGSLFSERDDNRNRKKFKNVHSPDQTPILFARGGYRIRLQDGYRVQAPCRAGGHARRQLMEPVLSKLAAVTRTTATESVEVAQRSPVTACPSIKPRTVMTMVAPSN
jgi:hypothetical protein